MNPKIWLWGLMAAACASACADRSVVVEDTGRVCAYPAHPEAEPPGSTVTYEAGQPVFFRVTVDECLSACIEEEVASCSVTRDGDRLVVRSTFSYDEPAGAQACIALCHSLEAVCESEPLEAGSYQVEHGDTTYPLVVPAAGTAPCLD